MYLNHIENPLLPKKKTKTKTQKTNTHLAKNHVKKKKQKKNISKPSEDHGIPSLPEAFCRRQRLRNLSSWRSPSWRSCWKRFVFFFFFFRKKDLPKTPKNQRLVCWNVFFGVFLFVFWRVLLEKVLVSFWWCLLKVVFVNKRSLNVKCDLIWRSFEGYCSVFFFLGLGYEGFKVIWWSLEYFVVVFYSVVDGASSFWVRGFIDMSLCVPCLLLRLWPRRPRFCHT